MFITNATDLFADGTKAVLVVEADPRRKALNIFAGTEDLWFGGNKGVQGGTIGNRIAAGTSVEIKTSAEIWVIRLAPAEGQFSYSEEFNGDG